MGSTLKTPPGNTDNKVGNLDEKRRKDVNVTARIIILPRRLIFHKKQDRYHETSYILLAKY